MVQLPSLFLIFAEYIVLEWRWSLVVVGHPSFVRRHRTTRVVTGSCWRSWSGTARSDIHLGFNGGFAVLDILLTQVLKACELADEVQVDSIGCTATVLGDNKFGKALDIVPLSILTGTGIILGAVDEAHDVGILLDSARFTQVAQLWAFTCFVIFGATCLNTAVEL